MLFSEDVYVIYVVKSHGRINFRVRLFVTNSQRLNYAIDLRKKGFFEESRNILLSLLASDSGQGTLYLNIAWSYDNQGLEKEALEYYTKSLNETLSEDEYFEAKFGLACTHRCLGNLHDAEQIFEILIKDYPSKTEIVPFFALCLMSLDKMDRACELLFELLIQHPPTQAISSYRRALLEYYSPR
nr:tetratricopeptide repeat protein [Rosenbergiella australiborealis]